MKTRLLIISLAALTVTGCSKLAELITFNFNAQTSITVNSPGIINTPFELSTPPVTTNSTEAFENNHSTPDLIKKVVLEEVKLTITNPQNKTFSFLKTIHVYISADGYPETQIAYLENIPATVNTITLVTTQENLDKYIRASGYSIRTSVETRETLTQSTDIKVEMKFAVTAGIL
jgi:hypothetical protein